MDAPAAIVATAVTYRYRHRAVLEKVGLAFGRGVLGLLGPNGAGKTTLLRLLATAMVPTAGGLRLMGHDPSTPAGRAAVRARLGYLPQQFGYYSEFSVAEFVEYFALLKGVSTAGVEAAVGRALAAVDLVAERRTRLRALSGGMLRRAGIAQALVNEPELLLLDEPTVGLDPAQRLAFRQLLRTLGQRATVVVSTHLVEDVAAACTLTVILDRGRIVFQGTPEVLVQRGEGYPVGDSPIERGYSAVLAGMVPAEAADGRA